MDRRAWGVSFGCVGLATLLFAIDLRLHLGISTGPTYVVVVALAAGLPSGRLILAIASLSAFLAIVGFFASPPGGVLWMAAINRVISLAAIGTVAYLSYRRRQSEDRLRQTNRELDGFVHTVSHDLRSPLSPILGYAELLRAEYGSRLDETGQVAIDEIEKQALRMLGLLDDLLQLATAGELARPQVAIDADAVLRQVLIAWQPMIVKGGGEVRCTSLPPVAVAESLLYQLFDNLIGNAARYAPGSLIEVGGATARNAVCYFVRDHGPGVPLAERKLIFQPFHRGTSSRTIPGTGIGLATVQKIAVSHGGRAWVEETPGGGSTFRVELRVSSPSTE